MQCIDSYIRCERAHEVCPGIGLFVLQRRLEEFRLRPRASVAVAASVQCQEGPDWRRHSWDNRCSHAHSARYSLRKVMIKNSMHHVFKTTYLLPFENISIILLIDQNSHCKIMLTPISSIYRDGLRSTRWSSTGERTIHGLLSSIDLHVFLDIEAQLSR